MGEFSRNQIGTLFGKLVGWRIWIPLDNWQFCLVWLSYSCSTQTLCWSTTFQLGALVRYFRQSHNGWATWTIPPSVFSVSFKLAPGSAPSRSRVPGRPEQSGTLQKVSQDCEILGGIMTRLCAAVAALHSRHSHAVEQIRTVAVPLSILDASRPMGLFWVHEHPWAPVALVFIQQAGFFIIGKLLPRLWL